MEESQPHDSQNRIIKHQTLGLSTHYHSEWSDSE